MYAKNDARKKIEKRKGVREVEKQEVNKMLALKGYELLGANQLSIAY